MSPRGISKRELEKGLEALKADAREHPERYLTDADRFRFRIEDLEAALAEEREKNERLRGLLAEAVEWARRPSPIPIRPFNDFIDRAALASTGSEE